MVLGFWWEDNFASIDPCREDGSTGYSIEYFYGLDADSCLNAMTMMTVSTDNDLDELLVLPKSFFGFCFRQTRVNILIFEKVIE